MAGKTFSDTSGDGVTVPFICVNVQLPDVGSSTVGLEGNVQAVGGAVVPIATATVTAPTVPGSGVINWVIQVNTTTGVATIKQSPTTPQVADAGNIVVYSDVMSTTDTNLGNDPLSVEPDQW